MFMSFMWCTQVHFAFFIQQDMLDPPTYKISFLEMLEITPCNTVSFHLHKDTLFSGFSTGSLAHQNNFIPQRFFPVPWQKQWGIFSLHLWKDYFHFCSVPLSQAHFQLSLYLLSGFLFPPRLYHAESSAVQESSFSLHPVLGRDETYTWSLFFQKQQDATKWHEITQFEKCYSRETCNSCVFWVTFIISDGIVYME